MNYRRVLLLVETGRDASRAFDVLRALLPRLEELVVVAKAPAAAFAGLPGQRQPLHDDTAASLAALERAAARTAPASRIQLVPEPGSEALAAICAEASIDLLADGTTSPRSALVLRAVRRKQGLPILRADGDLPPGPARVLCFADDARARQAIRAFLRDHSDASMDVTMVGPEAAVDVAALREIAGIDAAITTQEGSFRTWLDGARPIRPTHLLVFGRASAAAFFAHRRPAPALLLPPLPSSSPRPPRALDLADVADLGGPLRLRVDLAAVIGDLPPLPDQALAILAGGRVVATVRTHEGEALLPDALRGSALGVARLHPDEAPREPLLGIEQTIAVVRPGPRPLILFDATLADETLRALHGLAGPPPPDLLAVRLRPSLSCRSIRSRLRACGLPPHVVDARAVLDEGPAFDVSEAADPVRLARVATRLRSSGYPVATIVHRGPIQPLVEGFSALAEPALLAGEASPAPTAAPSSAPIAGNRIAVELDNAQARRWLLEAIERSRETLHLQVYMAADDEVGAQVEAALAAAGARGVRVRILVDSLHGLHGSFGTENPLLARLAAHPGVELRASRPIREIPSLVDLKLRDHRKIVVADGGLALVGGRNLSHEYYTGFDEVALTPDTHWREVPWIDAGARLQGPAVAAIEASFRAAWVDAGGASFDVATPPPAGASTARVIVHHGLRDARTLEAYLELIATARARIDVLNGFPLMLELQHALVAAIERGVQVRTLVGHLTPTHGGRPFTGPWSAARLAATELIHARMDPIVAAGGEARLCRIAHRPGWAPDLGPVQPHVHAKLMCVDGERCAVGSANFDLTSAYWESELLLVVEDAAVVRQIGARIDELFAGSVPTRRDDPAWQALASRRAWTRHWPGVLSI